MLTAIVLIALTLVLFIACQAIVYSRRIAFSESLARQAQSWHKAPENPRRTMVVIGDSLAVGLGARAPEESIAGRLARRFPHAAIYNYAKTGARARDAMAQLGQFPLERADVVLVQMCANDVAAVNPIAEIERQMRAVVAKAQALGARVILMPGGNFCEAPFFFWPAQPVLKWRALHIREMLARLAQETGSEFVDLFCDAKDDPFLREPHRYFSEDLIHPTGDGYAFYFTTLLRKARLEMYLA